MSMTFLELLKAGGLRLSKWTANQPYLLESLASKNHAFFSDRTWHLDEHTMLGVSWKPAEDIFRFHAKLYSSNDRFINRKVLSPIAQLYDPLGWITPVIIEFKIFMQSVWHAGLQWDDLLPPHLLDRWIQLISHLDHLDMISIPRWTGQMSNLKLLEIHGFADASERAYAAVTYLKTVDSNHVVKLIILLAKSKVSPLKQVSLPRLELCGAVLLAKLVTRIQETLKIQIAATHLWLDSTVALSWIQGHPTRWKTYVANRVSEIQRTIPQAAWHHVKSADNPADIASRGISPQDLAQMPLWFSGPKFLTDSIDPWPSGGNYDLLNDCPDQRSVACVLAKVQPCEWDLVTKYSSLIKLLRVTARCQHFIKNCRLKINSKSIQEVYPLTPSDLIIARNFWVRHVQETYLFQEYQALSNNKEISRKSSILRLNPIYQDGLIRVGGRLKHSILQPDEKHPLILPQESKFTKLVILDAHKRTLHAGTQLTLSFIRQQFWIVRGRQAVKSVIFKCVTCWRQTSQPQTQLMGDLPAARVQLQRPFLHSGVDYAGPINLRLSHGRGNRSYKGYIAVFVCLATRAIHLEAASDYTSQEFLNVYRRFTARRGICATLSSDCGTNFVGANRELRKLFIQASSSSLELAQLLANDGTEWKFNPPSAPHFGGLWEAAVKSVKFHLKRVIGESTLTFEEMTTLLTQIEACLNSRPIQALSDDPTSLEILTPAHFLIGTSLATVPEPIPPASSKTPRTRWQMIRQMHQHFWKRWSNEYLHELQNRPKWQRRQDSVKAGDLCIVRTNLSPPCKWPLARIIEVIPGSDGLVRIVKLRTASSTYIRPISKISILPFQE